ncbi:alpha/beta fold hydrolase [Amnibacterium sp. CER49]|uniref:alpha/beta fold hydrolase n=1 Tax=Amnibacterium sp. CER49 TaxID=3039161 RepID=UPI00244CDC4C|nr:alpha/beta fold hydrolase [Amnibacterium sp. CER49]MDH2442747.1 alpha/beta fold hydrolase [Amnibacterium sp. CER49]
MSAAAPAALPPEGLPGLDRAWSRLVTAPSSDGARRTWHLLDTGPALEAAGVRPVGTVLAVHGNPTWSYLWREVVAASLEAERPWRVVAVDQLEMGWSERTGAPRTVADRVRDLGLLTDALGLDGPVVPLGHDWGGIVAMGWAVDHAADTAGVVLANTALPDPTEDVLPGLLRFALTPAVTRAGTSGTTAFLETTLRIAHPPLPPEVRAAYRAPYRGAARRAGIEQFVRDIPADPSHPSAAELARIAEGVGRLAVPVLLLWGPRDPVFQERYLAGLMRRMPHADVHRFEGAGHLLPEDVALAPVIRTWLETRLGGDRPAELAAYLDAAPYEPLWSVLDARRDESSTALVEMRGGTRPPRVVSWRLLARRIESIAAGLLAVGVRRGQRVSLLVPPGADLTAALYACLRIGAVVVVADAGLGLQGMTRAVNGARPDWIIGVPAALGIARALGWPGVRILAGGASPALRNAIGARHTLAELAATGDGVGLPPEPAPDDLAAVLFTSGSTGPAKGVRYTYRRLAGVRDALRRECGLGQGSGLVAGFAPFALLGPALGCRTATPEMDVTRPATLTAERLAASIAAVDADSVFLSPAAMANVVATADEAAAFERIRLVLSAGAPLGGPLLDGAARVFPQATIRTPYGMTECLLVTDVTLTDIREAGSGNGVCVGRPITGVRVRIAPLDADGVPHGSRVVAPGTTGEIEVSAPHMLTGYDRLWLTDRRARAGTSAQPWHRTGDVGHLDEQGRLWVEGRLQHVIVTADGVVTPVGVEQRAESVGVRRAAAVGVGPRGTQQLVVVVEDRPSGLVEPALADSVRAAVGEPVAAVLGVPRLPTDIRHNSKIDRALLARWAEAVLAGERPPRW